MPTHTGSYYYSTSIIRMVPYMCVCTMNEGMFSYHRSCRVRSTSTDVPTVLAHDRNQSHQSPALPLRPDVSAEPRSLVVRPGLLSRSSLRNQHGEKTCDTSHRINHSTEYVSCPHYTWILKGFWLSCPLFQHLSSALASWLELASRAFSAYRVDLLREPSAV